MKKHTLIAGHIALLALATLSLQAADQKTTYAARSGSKMRIEGTSNVHDWQVEGSIIGGFMEVGPGFPAEPGQTAVPGKIEAKAEAFISARSLRSIEKDGRPYSDAMDGIMYEKLKASEDPATKKVPYPRIEYRLSELVLKESPKAKEGPYVFDTKGDLMVAGVSKTISMVVNVTPMADKKVKISGTTTIKMTDFKIDPPAPKIALGLIKTGDDVKLIFEWMLAPRKAPAAASN
ncbi:MAG: YceI family protein [Verrucomicrobiota bacterium]